MKVTATPVSKGMLAWILLFLTIATTAQSTYRNEDNVQQSHKTYTQSYPLGAESVFLENRFGHMLIKTWDKNEVKVIAEITVGSDDKVYADSVLNHINIIEKKEAKSISFKTSIGELGNNNYHNQSIRVDYEVYLPSTTTLYAENTFGPLDIGDYKGAIELYCKYGNLTTGKLDKAQAITIEYGKGYIESITNTELTARYTRLDIRKIAGSFTAKLEFCNSLDLDLDNSLTAVNIKSSYTSLNLGLGKDLTADYSIVTDNGRLSSHAQVEVPEEKSTADFAYSNYYSPSHRYTGSIGKGGNTHITIHASFGNVRFM